MASVAGAQTVHSSADAALKAAAVFGKPVLLVYTDFNTTCPLCKHAVNHMVGDPASVRFLSPYYELAKIQFDDKDEGLQNFRSHFKGNTYPFWIVATPDGEFIDGGDYHTVKESPQDPDNWRKRMLTLSASHPSLSPSDRAKAERMLARAKVAFDAGQFGSAYADAQVLTKVLWYPPDQAEEVAKIISDVETGGKEALAAAAALADAKEYLQAAMAYKRILEDYAKLPAALEAAKQCRAVLARDSQAAAEFSKTFDVQRAEELLARAKNLETRNKPEAARLVYKAITSQYGVTPAAAQARDALAAKPTQPAPPTPSP
jgi:tetratricopeptide (TPR) repeat protein